MSSPPSEHASLGMPLAGTRVIEVSEQASASYAGRLFALLGAEVIKLEDPGRPGLRAEAPFVTGSRRTGALFSYLNVAKKSVTCPRSGAYGHRLRTDLGRIADVFLDDRPVAERDAAGEGAEFYLAENPRLVYVSVLPFGATGPHAHYRGEEINTFHGCGEGFLLPNGLGNERFPEREPIKAYGHLSELQAGVGAALSAMAALFVRDQLGGQAIDIAVQDVNVALGAFNIQRYGDGTLETRQTRSFSYGGVLECADGDVELLVLEQHQWECLVEMLGSPAWALNPDYADPITRAQRGREINANLRAWAMTMPVAEVVRLARDHQVPLDRYNSPAAILALQHERVRGFISTHVLADGTTVEAPNLPFKLLPQREWPQYAGPPELGDSDDAVLVGFLGYGSEEINRLRSEALSGTGFSAVAPQKVDQ
jgi:crotonobetainyl-CoA:carnitine CoA-transferase CaiB-like acyl-CoA transferase